VFLIGLVAVVGAITSLVATIFAGPGAAGQGPRIAAFLLVVVVLAVLVRTWAAVHRSGRVLDDIVEQASRVEGGDYSARVELRRRAPGAVRDLVRGFNTMAERLDADERQRRSLLADVTHELRTPLTVIAGNIEAILDGVHPADEAHLTAILDETRVMSRLVEDLRTLTLSEARSLSLHREPTDLEVLCSDVATAFAPAADEAGVVVNAHVDAAVPLVSVDPVRIREVLSNLVSNALRYAPRGGRIEIDVRMAGRAEGDRPVAANGAGSIEIEVRDTGPGIDAELLPHVFERFARGADSSGSGLGLSIARGLVELHGGTIQAAAPGGGGTAITIQLPVGGD
jgi:two-component system, OmpR family, sensor histidine kinase BaeS